MDGDRSTPDLESGPVLVIDFGAQYAQLIARRVGNARSTPRSCPARCRHREMLARNVRDHLVGRAVVDLRARCSAPRPSLLTAGIPVLGICYGFQLMVRDLGGQVLPLGTGSTGPPPCRRPALACASCPTPAARLDVTRRHLRAGTAQLHGHRHHRGHARGRRRARPAALRHAVPSEEVLHTGNGMAMLQGFLAWAASRRGRCAASSMSRASALRRRSARAARSAALSGGVDSASLRLRWPARHR